jgi:FAD/FMN-containing dehydrogenase
MLEEWRGGAELDLMRRIKAAIDPAGLMNPGKLFPS